MLKAATDNHLVLGLTPDELEILKQGNPLVIRLDDVGYQGSVVTIITGDTNEKLKEVIESVNRRRELMESVPQIDLSKTNVKRGN